MTVRTALDLETYAKEIGAVLRNSNAPLEEILEEQFRFLASSLPPHTRCEFLKALCLAVANNPPSLTGQQ